MEAPEQPAPLGSVAHVFGVPRYLYRTAARHARDWLAALLRRDQIASFDNELWLWFFAGIVRQRWKDRHGVRARHAVRAAV
jgi:hypothetical protein